MKFYIRDLCWLIFLVALACMAFLERRRLCTKISGLEDKIQLQKKEHWKELDAQKMKHVYAVGDLKMQHVKDMDDFQKKVFQRWSEARAEDRASAKEAKERNQEMKERLENPFQSLIPSQIPPQLRLPQMQFPHM